MIKVRIFGVARLNAGVSSFESRAGTVQELRKTVPGLTPKEAKDLLVLVNGKAVDRHYRFKDGDEAVLLSPAGGG